MVVLLVTAVESQLSLMQNPTSFARYDCGRVGFSFTQAGRQQDLRLLI